jgi:hypothetical protein
MKKQRATYDILQWYDGKPLTRRQRFLDAIGDIVWAKKHDAVAILEPMLQCAIYHYPPFTIVDARLTIERELFTATAVAKCCPNDTYNPDLGTKIARGRATINILEQLYARHTDLGGFAP